MILFKKVLTIYRKYDSIYVVNVFSTIYVPYTPILTLLDCLQRASPKVTTLHFSAYTIKPVLKTRCRQTNPFNQRSDYNVGSSSPLGWVEGWNQGSVVPTPAEPCFCLRGKTYVETS